MDYILSYFTKNHEADELYKLGMQHKDKNNLLMQKYLIKSSQLGNSDAMVELGQYYQDQYSLTGDPNEKRKFEKYYTSAMKLKHPEGTYKLALLYRFSPKYQEYLLLALRYDNVKAYRKIAELFMNNCDYDNMKKYFLLGFKNGDHSCIIDLGNYYNRETGYNCNQLALKYYLMGVEKNMPEAMYYAAGIYDQNCNHERTIYHYSKAAEQNHIPSMTALGNFFLRCVLFYEKSSIAHQNYRTLMLKYYEMAIDRGSCQSMYELAKYYTDHEHNPDMAKKYCFMIIDNFKTDKKYVYTDDEITSYVRITLKKFFNFFDIYFMSKNRKNMTQIFGMSDDVALNFAGKIYMSICKSCYYHKECILHDNIDLCVDCYSPKCP